MRHSSDIEIRDANHDDLNFVINLMCHALAPYYGGDHKRHAERIFGTHISGGNDRLGFFSTLQKMFIATKGRECIGMLHLVGKRQGTMKISPLIVSKNHRGGIGTTLLEKAETFAKSERCRQIYCTVAQQNSAALAFFEKNGFITTGRSDSHYKSGITELMLYKPLLDDIFERRFDRDHISVLPFEAKYSDQIRQLLLKALPDIFLGINDDWVTSLFAGYERRDSHDVNSKYKLIYLAIGGVVGATPKKGSPIKLMPFIAEDLPSFFALLKDMPFHMKQYGSKLYIHTAPSPDETIALQQCGWMLNGAMPAAYHPKIVTQQWSLDIGEKKTMRSMRVKDKFLKEIESGKKDLEIRVAYSSMKNIRVGEIVGFHSRTQSVVVEITDIRKYATFETMLEKEDADRIVPGYSNDTLLKLLRDIYPKDKEKLGVIALQINVKHQ